MSLKQTPSAGDVQPTGIVKGDEMRLGVLLPKLVDPFREVLESDVIEEFAIEDGEFGVGGSECVCSRLDGRTA